MCPSVRITNLFIFRRHIGKHLVSPPPSYVVLFTYKQMFRSRIHQHLDFLLMSIQDGGNNGVET